MRGLIALLFLADVFSIVAASDHFIFNLTFTCGYHQREKYNYNIQFFEVDTWKADNVLTPQKIGEARPGLAHFMMEGWQDGDQYWSAGYEVKMMMYHDCTEYLTEATVNLNIKPLCDIGKGTCRFTIKKELKDLNGEMDYQAKLEYS